VNIFVKYLGRREAAPIQVGGEPWSAVGGRDRLTGGRDRLTGGRDHLTGGRDHLTGGRDHLTGGRDHLAGEMITSLRREPVVFV